MSGNHRATEWINRREISGITGISYWRVLKMARNNSNFPQCVEKFDEQNGKMIQMYDKNEILAYFKIPLNRPPEFDNRLAQLFIRGMI